jgi:hypothetical protein
VEVNDGVNHPKDGGGGVVGYYATRKSKTLLPQEARGVKY